MASVSVAEQALYPGDNFTTPANPLLDASNVSTSYLQNPRVALGFLLVLIVVLGRVIGGSKKLPPGVKPLPMHRGLPWAGRFWDVPEVGVQAAWHFGALHKKYGPIYAWKVMGITHVWIQTDKVARDLFVLRQKRYSDRNELPAAVGVKSDCEILPLSGLSEDFKRHKNFIHTIMKHASPKAFYGWPMIENKKTLRRLIENPDRWSEHMITHCARTIASIAWGDPEHGKKLLYVVPDLLKAVSPAGPLINKLTFLMHLPEFMSPFKRAETRRRNDMTDAFYEALDDVKARVLAGTAEPCWSQLWLNHEKGVDACKLDYHEAAYAIGSSSFVAIATIGGPLHAIILAFCRYPEWLPKLQEEVDRVCGDRLPTFDDVPNMPRLRATVKEVLRWRQSTPLGVPHEAMEDDVYDGFLIPKGAMCHANHFLISRDERYPNPEQFIPERWLDPSYPTYKEPLTEFPNLRGDISFGYGTRACPGVDLTYMELCTLFGALAWTFDITPKVSKAEMPWYEVNPYVITMMQHFPVDFKPRSEEKRRWVMSEVEDPGYVLKKKAETRWDIVHDEQDGKPWTWEGLTLKYQTPAVPFVYPPGV